MTAFTPLLDRGLAAEGAALCAWCPTMDLLAIYTAAEAGGGGQLNIHRLNWQRLWTSSPEAPITALEWRPDGKQLAVGLEDGSVLLLNTEDGEVQHRRQLLPDALVAISWTEAAAGGAGGPAGQAAAGCGSRSTCGAGGQAAATTAAAQLADDRARRMFAPPPPPEPSAAAALELGYSTCGRHGGGGSGSSQAWAAEPPRLAVLACASSAGDLVLCTSGLFPLASLSLPRLLGAPSVSVLRLATAPSLQQLTVCWQEGDASSSGSGGALRLSTIAMQRVGAHAAQLHRLALAAAHVNGLLGGCLQSFQAACKEWQGGQRELGESRTRLSGLMSDYGATSGEPANELRRLLATGAVGGALQQYITVTLGEPGLKKLARAVDAAVCSVHNILTDHLQPQLEQLAFRLGELRGLALCLPWRRVTGLQPEQVSAAEQAALQLVLCAEAVRRRVVAVGAQYRTFFSWLLIILRRMQEDASDALAGYPRSQLDAVADFLAGQYREDAVGPLLGSTSDSSSSGGGAGALGIGSAGGGGGGSPGREAGAAAAVAAAGVAGGGMLDLVMQVLGRQALVQAADSTASPGAGGAAAPGGPSSSPSSSSSSLGQLLSALQAACTAAFKRTSEVVSPTLQLAGSLSLGPFPCALSATYLPQPDAAGAAAGQAEAVAAAAAAWEGQQHVLLLRSSSGGGGGVAAVGGKQAAAAAAEAAPAVQAALLQLPEGTSPVDLAFYREGQLALLLAGSGSSAAAQAQGQAQGAAGGAATAGCRLVLLPQPQLEFTELPADLLAESTALQLSQLLLDSSPGSSAPIGTPLPQDCRQRPLPYPRAQAPLAVSASRGVGCVLAGTQRVLLYDLEEDEEEEEAAEGGDEQLQDAQEGMDSDGAAYDSPTNR